MDDLGRALAAGGGHLLMLGGGNPALIPGVEEVWRRRIHEILRDGRAWERLLAIYDPPRGNAGFLSIAADYFRRRFGWDIGPEHIVVTAGGQSAFFHLFNLFAGESPDGRKRRILLPVMPEYIGYANQGLADEFFEGHMPHIQEFGGREFKYLIDFDALSVGDEIGAACVSRPTNPSGNVIDDGELARLSDLCAERGVPLIVDNAYGTPFPGILFRECRPIFAPHVINVFSLSKLGLPNTRTALVVAAPAITRAISSMTAVTGLANGTLGQSILGPLLASGEIDDMVASIIQPYYAGRLQQARTWLEEALGPDFPYRLHQTGGAMFLWLWLPWLPVTSRELYTRLKEAGVLVVPGRAFAFGSPAAEAHADQCIRISFAMDEETVHEGLERIASVVKALH
ncbi:MAG: valine--pyruvate transaminase [Terrimicrobiaceae bacterium]